MTKIKESLTGWILKGIPKKVLSHYTGELVQKKWPKPVSILSVKAFALYYGINLNEAEQPIENYKSIGELFTRKLKSGVRPLGMEPVHPADGKLSCFGTIDGGRMIQAKGRYFSVSEFVQDAELAEYFRDGTFYTYYLCPTDYHRVHSPVSGQITKSTLVPGELWPVNNWSVENVTDLFARNERVIVEIETAFGIVLVVFVGATNVGKISLSFDPFVVSNQKQKSPVKKTYSPKVSVSAGAELGIFHMGSTVVVLYPKTFPTNWTKEFGTPVQVNASLE